MRAGEEDWRRGMLVVQAAVRAACMWVRRNWGNLDGC